MSNLPPPPVPPGFLPPPASFTQKKKRRWPWVVGVACILVLIASALGDDEKEDAAAPTPPTSEVVAVTTTTAPPTTERTTTTMSTVERVARWYAEHGSILDDIVVGMDDVSTAASLGSPTLVGDACRDFRDVIDEAKALPPIPEETVDVHWQEALRLFDSGAATCIDGTALLDEDLITAAGEYLLDGSEEIALATDALESVGGV